MRSFAFYVSHSLRAEDLPRLAELQGRVASVGLGLAVHVPRRDLYPAGHLPIEIREDLGRSDLVLVLLGRGGRTVRWVETEIRYARARSRRIALLVEEGERIPLALAGADRLTFRGEDPRESFRPAAELVRGLRADGELAVIAVGLVLQVLGSSMAKP